MAPVVLECQSHDSAIEPVVCFTGQHREMLAQVGTYFGLNADVDLDLMRPNQSLSSLTSRCLEGLDEAIQRFAPDCIVAQGDTTTVMTASVAAFYRQLPFVHVEAGLRTGNLNSPWPEEFNRRVAGLVAALHCAPTEAAAQNVLAEGVEDWRVRVTGNTVIDALLWTLDRERLRSDDWSKQYSMLTSDRLVLITGHRRENFGDKFASICQAIATLARTFPDVDFVYPVHLNPNVQEPVHRLLGGLPNVHLVKPASYPEFVWLMDRSYLILTDSGGVQEEAPSLRKPVLVMRDTTERPEAVQAGAAELVGASVDAIVEATAGLLTNADEYSRRQIDINPYGDGCAAQRIVDLLMSRAWETVQSVRLAA
jgi:UDP-N-acetylglucosamine 2-epimerase (non-hydrolysing)